MCLLTGFNTLLIASTPLLIVRSYSICGCIQLNLFAFLSFVELSYFTQEPLGWIHCSMGCIKAKGTLYSVSSFYYLIDEKVSSVNSLNKLWCNSVIIVFDV